MEQKNSKKSIYFLFSNQNEKYLIKQFSFLKQKLSQDFNLISPDPQSGRNFIEEQNFVLQNAEVCIFDLSIQDTHLGEQIGQAKCLNKKILLLHKSNTIFELHEKDDTTDIQLYKYTNLKNDYDAIRRIIQNS